MPDSQRYPWNHYIVTSLEDIVVFPGLKVFNSDNSCMFFCSRNAQVTSVNNPNENNQFSKIVSIDIQFILDQTKLLFVPLWIVFLESLHRGSLKIKPTVPLIWRKSLWHSICCNNLNFRTFSFTCFSHKLH